MTLHASERSRLAGDRKAGIPGETRLDRWDGPQRSQVALPSPYSLASVLALGLLALSLSVAGIGWQIIRWRKK